MNSSKLSQCPECDSHIETAFDGITYFDCGSTIASDQPFHQSRPCLLFQLKNYSQHKRDCQVWLPLRGCDCGLNKLLKKIESYKM